MSAINKPTLPAGSTGLVQFNSSGAFGADSKLNWDAEHESLLVGGYPSVLPIPIPSVEIVSNGSGVPAAFIGRAYGSGSPSLFGFYAGGSITSPAASTPDPFLRIIGIGHDGVDWDLGHPGGYVTLSSNETWSPTGHGTLFYLDLCAAGSTTLSTFAFQVMGDGGGRIGVGGPIAGGPRSTIHALGIPVFANNAAAITGGLTAGAFYRLGVDPDLVCVVH